MEESFMRHGSLVEELAWIKHIDELKATVRKLPEQTYKRRLLDAIVAAHRRRIPKHPYGLLLSGGVDSTFMALILKQFGDFTAYSVGIEGSKDLDAARNAAEVLELKHRWRAYTLPEVEKIIWEVVHILQDANPVKVGVAAVELAAIRLAKQDRVHFLFGGLGTEEIFAGYERHALANNVTEECWRGLRAMHERDLVRDAAIATHEHVSLLTPFLDDDVILVAMGIDATRKISKQEKKIILREIADEYGLPRDIAQRKKSAAQYGSGFDKAMGKLAKQRGYKNKRAYLQTLLEFTTFPDKNLALSRGQN